MHHLLLQPVRAEVFSPPLQIYLKGNDSDAGLRQPLHIYSITAVFEECSHVLLLPDHAVDVEFRRQTLYRIYTTKQKKKAKNQIFFQQLLNYLNQAQGQETPGFAISVALNLPPDLVALRKRLNLAGALGLLRSLKSCGKVPATKYVLAAFERVDVSSFSHDAAKGLCLDHIQFSELDGMQSRQELRLAERPYPDILGSSSPFSHLFDGAYAVASWLGDPKVLKEDL